MAHTPIPWEVTASLQTSENHRGWRIDGGGWAIGQVFPHTENGSPMQEANAAFIVKAVNNHEELVEALRKLAIGRHMHSGIGITDGYSCANCDLVLHSDVHYRGGEDAQTDLATARALLAKLED